MICPQVKVMEIFDVTQTDPSLLVSDSMGIQYSMDDQVSNLVKPRYLWPPIQVLPNDGVSRLRHSSGPSTLASKSRRNSVQSLGFPSSQPGYLPPTTSTQLQKRPEKTKRGAFASLPKTFYKIFGKHN